MFCVQVPPRVRVLRDHQAVHPQPAGTVQYSTVQYSAVHPHPAGRQRRQQQRQRRQEAQDGEGV